MSEQQDPFLAPLEDSSHYPTNESSAGELYRLNSGMAQELLLTIPPLGETPVIAQIQTSNNADVTNNKADVYSIIDLRNAKKTPTGEKRYEGYLFSPKVEFLVTTKDVDFEHGKGYKGIRETQGEVFFGRFDINTMASDDHRSRFDSSKYTSRNHFSVECTNDGLRVRDTGSLNGTLIKVENHTKNFSDEASNKNEVFNHLGKESSATNALMKMYEFFPRQKIEIDGREFLLSDVVQSSRYSYAVMYTSITKGNKPMIVPRFLYKSQSDGGWRVGYGIDEKGRFIKEADKKEWHYTQETKLDPKILEALDNSGAITNNGQDLEKHLLSIFSTQNAFSDESDSRHEISYYHNPDIDALIAPVRYLSAGFLDKEGSEKLKDAGYRSVGDYLNRLDIVFDKLPGFMPDFHQPPLTIEKRGHTLLGQVNVEYYPAHLGSEPIVWSIASDQHGRVWIDNIRLVNNKVSSYGTSSRVFDAGVLTSKPLEYAEQSSGLTDNERTRFNNEYYDITAALRNLLPVRLYLEAHDILGGSV